VAALSFILPWTNVASADVASFAWLVASSSIALNARIMERSSALSYVIASLAICLPFQNLNDCQNVLS
jgi:hypothetical protein